MELGELGVDDFVQLLFDDVAFVSGGDDFVGEVHVVVEGIHFVSVFG